MILGQKTYCSQPVARKSTLTGVDEIEEDGGGHLLELLQHVLSRGKSRHLQENNQAMTNVLFSKL